MKLLNFVWIIRLIIVGYVQNAEGGGYPSGYFSVSRLSSCIFSMCGDFLLLFCGRIMHDKPSSVFTKSRDKDAVFACPYVKTKIQRQ